MSKGVMTLTAEEVTLYLYWHAPLGEILVSVVGLRPNKQPGYDSAPLWAHN